MAGIDSIINTRADAFTNNPQALMQRYAMGQDLLDLLALQKLKQDKEAAARSLQMGMQVPQGTIKDQLQGQVMDMTKREVVQAVAPGLQQQGQRMAAQQAQNMIGAGLPTQPAPALQGMAQGGIVGYADGGTPYSRSALDRFDERRRAERGQSGSFLSRVGEAEMDRAYAENQAAELIKEDPSILALMALGAVSPELAPLLARVGTRANPVLRDIAKYGDDLPSAGSLPRRVFDPRQAVGAAGVTGIGALLSRGDRSPDTNAIGSGESTLRDVLNRVNVAPEENRQATPPSGTPEKNIPVSRDALRRFDERRRAETDTADPPSGTPEKNIPVSMDALRRFDERRRAETDTADAESSGIMSFFKSLADNYKNAMRIQGEGNRVLYNPGAVLAAQYVSMMENPELAEAGMTDLERAKAMGLIPDERPSRPAPQPTTATASQPTTQAAPTTRPAITAPTEEGIAALFNDMTARREQPTEQPKYRSRYEDRLAEIEAEKQDRIGALIDFLQAAGASGGTNLGATLMGGGSGLRAREERLRQQEADALKSIIEDEQAQQAMGFRERELAQQAEQNALNRSLQASIAAANRASQEGMTADEIASRKDIAQMQVDEAVKRAQAAAGANIAEFQMNALIEARKAMADDALLNQQFMRIQQQYKNNPVEMDVQMQILTDEYLDNYLAPVGLSSGSSNIGGMKTPAPTN